MKILYVITKSNWGGAQRHVFDLATHFKTQGHEVIVALGGEGMLRDRLREAGIATRPIAGLGRDISLTKDSSSFGDIFKIIKEVRPDVLHLHSPKAAGLGSLAGRLLRVKKIIYTVHGWAFNEDRSIHQKSAMAFFSWLTMLFSTHIITLSEKETAQAQAFPWVARKIRMIPQGIIPPKFFATASARLLLEQKMATSFDKKILVGTIAELHPNKGLFYAINAFEKVAQHHPSAILFIIGSGELEGQLRNLIKEKNLEKNVILAGYLEHAAEYLKAFNIFLLSSIKEGLPYTLIEAGYAGLPVVATTVGGIPEVIEDMKTGILIQPKKSAEISHALEFLIEHKTVQREYAKNLNEKVKARHNLEETLRNTAYVYEEPVTR